MFDIWKNLKDLVHVNDSRVTITNAVFVLHSKVTVIILLGLSILVTSKQYLGDPIDCISSNDIKNIADKYCWIHSTYTRGRLDSDGKWGYEAEDEDGDVQPGIRPAVAGEDPKIYHTYYQWVWAVLFIQGGLFYLPFWFWKITDRGRIKMLVSDLNLQVLSDEEHVSKQKEAILRYFSPNKGHHTLYAWQYICCELLSFINVVFQIYCTDVFLNHEFSSYGLNLFFLSQKRPYLRYDALSKVFPTVTACRMATGGVAFGTMEYDLLCILPINILNEKIYIFLWFWFILMAILSAMNLIYRIVTICVPPFREYLLRRHVRKKQYNKISCGYGDWFLLNKLGENINPIVFGELLHEIYAHTSLTKDDDADVVKPLNGSNNKISQI